jgi:nicotinamidase-related amidase
MKDRTALLLVGMQRGSWPDAVDDALVGRLLEVARARGRLVVHCPELRLPGGLTDSAAQRRLRQALGEGRERMVDGTVDVVPRAGFEPAPGEPVVERRRDCAFTDTRLETILRSNGIGPVVIAGARTSRAIVTTALAARSRDHLPFVVAGAVADEASEQAAALEVLSKAVMLVTDATAAGLG